MYRNEYYENERYQLSICATDKKYCRVLFVDMLRLKSEMVKLHINNRFLDLFIEHYLTYFDDNDKCDKLCHSAFYNHGKESKNVIK